jgi:hypothetical protein
MRHYHIPRHRYSRGRNSATVGRAILEKNPMPLKVIYRYGDHRTTLTGSVPF